MWAPSASLREIGGQFGAHRAHRLVVESDEQTSALAADLAEAAGVRSLDALHLAAPRRVGTGALSLVTYEVRLAQAAHSIGWTVVGA